MNLQSSYVLALEARKVKADFLAALTMYRHETFMYITNMGLQLLITIFGSVTCRDPIAAQKNTPNSMQEYIRAEIEHQQELNFHLKATKEYVKLVKNRTNWWQEFSANISR